MTQAIRLLFAFLLCFLIGCGAGHGILLDEIEPQDRDQDGFYDCSDPDNCDCNDYDSQMFPGNPEICDGRDNDCDEQADEDEVCGVDQDGDGMTPDAGDCNDENADVYLDAPELCDGVDNDCDGELDEGFDADGDGYLDASACEDGDDCNDGNASVNPGAVEVCDDGIDQDCNEDNESDGSTWHVDADEDGFGDANSSEVSCEAPSEAHVLDGSDCDDGDPAVNPDATEVCDEVDNDCEGTIDQDAVDTLTWYLDADDDGYGLDTATATACEEPASYSSVAGDCDDGNAAVYPGQTEYCDGLDNDCDGDTDEDDAADATEWFADADGDSYGDAASSQFACSAPANHVADDTDCDDADGTIYPGASESFGDGVDQDCDGIDNIWYYDGEWACVTANVFPATHSGCDADGDGAVEAYLVGESPFGPWSELQIDNTVELGAHAAGFLCYDFSVRSAGYFEYILVSECDASNPSDPVTLDDSSTWEIGDFETYCASGTDPEGACHTHTDTSEYAGTTMRSYHYTLDAGATWNLEGAGTYP